MTASKNQTSLKTVYPTVQPDSLLAENLLAWLESLPHAQRLYPELFVNDLAQKVEKFFQEE